MANVKTVNSNTELVEVCKKHSSSVVGKNVVINASHRIRITFNFFNNFRGHCISLV